MQYAYRKQMQTLGLKKVAGKMKNTTAIEGKEYQKGYIYIQFLTKYNQ